MANNSLDLVILDIGGVVAEITKASLLILLEANRMRESEFFDAEFSALQAGHINSEVFIRNKSQKLGVHHQHLAGVFMEMIDATTAKKVLPSLKIPYLFFSNINELHFDALSRTLPLPKFAKRHSLLSHQVGYLKPARHIFSALRETVARTASSALYVDDKQENLRQGHRIGLRTAHCPRPEVLGDVLRQFSLI